MKAVGKMYSMQFVWVQGYTINVENNMSEHVLVVSLYVDKTVILAGLRKYSIFIWECMAKKGLW